MTLEEELEFVVAQLRHAYTQLKVGSVARQPEFADGLISPQIKRLERIIAEGNAGWSPATDC